MFYDGFLPRLQHALAAEFGKVHAVWNFDLGNDFEPILCRVLRSVLPAEFGVCRGFVVAKDGERAGDDIIIYDRLRFPMLRMLGEDDYSQKQLVPVEAVLAYIEAKHSLILDRPKKGSKWKGQSLDKACEQVGAVKAISRWHRQVTPYKKVARGGRVEKEPGEPIIVRQPIFGMVFTPKVRETSRDKKGTSELKVIGGALLRVRSMRHFTPDCLVLGDRVLGLHYQTGQVEGAGDLGLVSRLFADETEKEHLSNLRAVESLNDKGGLAFAAGVCQLMWALEQMRIWQMRRPMPWNEVVAQTFGGGSDDGGFSQSIPH